MTIEAALNIPTPTGMLPMNPGPAAAAVDAMLTEQRDAEGERPHAFNRRLRASWAGTCSRQQGLRLLEFPPDLATEGKALRIFDAGHRAHDRIQGALIEAYGIEIEKEADWYPELDLGCSLDGAGLIDGTQTGIEIKSMAPFGFEIATGQRRRDELPGPKYEHVLQSGLGSLSPTINAEQLWIIYYNKATSDIAEWIFGVDEPLPHLEGRTVREMVADELRRMAGILARIDAGELPRAVVPGYGLVTDPPARNSKGQPWGCRYCAFQPTCKAVGPEVVTIDHLKSLTQQRNTEKGA